MTAFGPIFAPGSAAPVTAPPILPWAVNVEAATGTAGFFGHQFLVAAAIALTAFCAGAGGGFFDILHLLRAAAAG
jgi:hypothetical protein